MVNPRTHDWVAYHALRQPDAPALTLRETGATRSWAALEQRVGKLAWALRNDHGIASGDRVALIAENDIRLFELQFACMRLGAILVPLNWRLSSGELVALVRDAAPKLLIHDELWAEQAAKILADGGIASQLAWSDDLAASGYDRLIEQQSEAVPGGLYDDDAITHILYTSGTTGLPKGAMCSQSSLKHHALAMAQTSRLAERGNHHLNIVPLFHAGALNTFSNPTLYWGGHVTTIRRFDPAVTLALLTNPAIGITHMCGVLQMYEPIAALPGFATATLSSMRAILFGGWGPKATEVRRQWQKSGLFPQLAYGSTEQGPLITILESDEALATATCSGRVVAGAELRIADAEGQALPVGSVGEIQTRGPSITPGYWRRPREDYFTRDGWFRSGDAGRLDETGGLYVVDRLKEIYRSGGENIYPAEIELILAGAPGVRDICVIGISDDRWGEVGMAIVEPLDGAAVTLDSLLEYAHDRLARFKFPRYFAQIDNFPRNATSKIDRAELKKRYGRTSTG